MNDKLSILNKISESIDTCVIFLEDLYWELEELRSDLKETDDSNAKESTRIMKA